MFKHLQSNLQWRNDLLLRGRYEDLARTFQFPMVVYYGDELLHLANEDAAQTYLRRARHEMMERGVQSCHVKVIAISLPVRGRFKVWAERVYHGTRPEDAFVSPAVYYMIDTPQGLRSEMLEFAACSLPIATTPRKAWSTPF